MNKVLVAAAAVAIGAAVIVVGVIVGISGVIEYNDRYGIFNFEEPDPLEL